MSQARSVEHVALELRGLLRRSDIESRNDGTESCRQPAAPRKRTWLG